MGIVQRKLIDATRDPAEVGVIGELDGAGILGIDMRVLQAGLAEHQHLGFDRHVEGLQKRPQGWFAVIVRTIQLPCTPELFNLFGTIARRGVAVIQRRFLVGGVPLGERRRSERKDDGGRKKKGYPVWSVHELSANCRSRGDTAYPILLNPSPELVPRRIPDTGFHALCRRRKS